MCTYFLQHAKSAVVTIPANAEYVHSTRYFSYIKLKTTEPNLYQTYSLTVNMTKISKTEGCRNLIFILTMDRITMCNVRGALERFSVF